MSVTLIKLLIISKSAIIILYLKKRYDVLAGNYIFISNFWVILKQVV